MRYALSVNFEGSVGESETEQHRTITLNGSGEPPESNDQWGISAQFAWPRTSSSDLISARAELQAPMGAALHGTLRAGAVNTVTNGGGEGEAWMLDLDFTVDESSGWFANTQGTIRLGGIAARQAGFQLTANLELDAPADAWFPLNGGLLTDAEADAGASHVGPNPLRRYAEHGTDRSIENDRKEEVRMAEREQRRHNPPGVTSGSPERPAEQMAAPEMVFDLGSELEQLHRESSWTTGERNGKTLVHERDFRIVLTAMHAGTRLAEHEADARVSIQTVDGHLRVHLPNLEVDLPLGHLLALDRSAPHEVEALEDSALLLTLAWPGDGSEHQD